MFLELNFETEILFYKRTKRKQRKKFFSEEVPPLNLPPLAQAARGAPSFLVTPLYLTHF